MKEAVQTMKRQEAAGDVKRQAAGVETKAGDDPPEMYRLYRSINETSSMPCADQAQAYSFHEPLFTTLFTKSKRPTIQTPIHIYPIQTNKHVATVAGEQR